jgi:hypothetical protein
MSIWRSVLCVTVCLAPSFAFGQLLGQTEGQREEWVKLSGQWTPVAGRAAGQDIPKDELPKFKLSARAIEFPPLRPVLIHWSQSGNVFLFGDGTVGFGGGKMHYGFYVWEGERLVVCACTSPMSSITPLTTSLEEAKNGPFIIVTFERAKP